MAIVGSHLRLVESNPAFAGLIGRGRACRGTFVGELLPDHVVERLRECLIGRFHEFRLSFELGDGWVSMQASPLRPRTGVVYSGLVLVFERAISDADREVMQTLRAQEAERKRVARELHDGVGQLLSTAHLVLKTESAAGADVDVARAAIAEAIQAVRRISRNLRPAALDDLGLVAAVRQVCNRSEEIAGHHITVSCIGIPRRLSEELESHAFRVVQEALHNVERHASASQVEVGLRLVGDCLEIRVRDDGVGMSTSQSAGNGGTGLSNIRWRAERMGGTFHLDSKPGQGTSLVVHLCKATSPPSRS